MLVKELKGKSTKELNQLINDLKAELFTLRFQNSTGQLDQPHKISLVKKDIARVFTVLNEKEESKADVKKVTKPVKTAKKEGDK